jgi:hypothetical protein
VKTAATSVSMHLADVKAQLGTEKARRCDSGRVRFSHGLRIVWDDGRFCQLENR